MFRILLLSFFSLLTFGLQAQLVANGNTGQTTTAYTNGATNNPIYIWCGTTLGQNQGSLTATPTSGTGPFTFKWYYHDQTTSSWALMTTVTGASSTQNNLASDGYRVEILNSSGVMVNCYIAWVWNLNTAVTASNSVAGCNTANLTSTINTNGSFTYYNPPPPQSIINSATNITVCFTGTHTWVSDVAFYLVGPVSCGSPTILLSPNPGAIGQGSVCNSGDNISNLCFSRTSTNTLNVCTAATPLTGTYGRYGPANTPINWTPLNGCNAAAGGWRVQIYDCIGGDVGTLTNATITFSNLTSSCGSPTSITYNSGAMSSAINDNSCSAATASVYQVPVNPNLNTPITINATTTLLWSSTVPITNATNATASAPNLPNGTTNFTLTATTSYGGVSCTSSATTAATIVLPTMNPVTAQTYCPNQLTPITPFSSSNAGVTYAWTNSNVAIGLSASGSGNLPSFTTVNNTAAPLVATITVTPSTSTCTGTPITFTITVNPTPLMTANTAITACAGTAISGVTYASTPVGATFGWTNSNAAIGLATSGNGNMPGFTATNSGSTAITGTISVTPTLNGCTGLASSYVITINPTPVISPVSAITVCSNDIIPITTLTATPSSSTISWSNSNTTIGLAASGTGDIPSFTGSAPNGSTELGTITITASNLSCTATPVTFDISINVLPVADPVTSITACHGDIVPSISFSSLPSGATFDWTNSNSSVGIAATGTGTINAFTATNPTTTATTATISVTPTIGSCVGSSITFNITVNPTPVPSASNNGPLCTGQTLNLTATGLPGSSYSWTGPNGFNAAIQNPTSPVVNGSSGTYTVTVTALSCVGTASTTLVSNPLQTPIITSVNPLCQNASSVFLTADIPGGTWSGNGIVNTSTGEFNPGAAQIGSNTVTYTLSGPCTVPATTSIVVNPLPTVAFTSPDLSGCEPFTTSFIDQTQPTSNSVLWNFGDGITSTQTGTINHTFNTPGCYTITLTSTSAAGCTATESVSNYICVSANALASFDVDHMVQGMMEPVFNCINSSLNASIYSWNFGDGSTSNGTNAQHEYNQQPGTYVITLIANNAGNCPDTAKISVLVEDQLIYYVPNSFTPDGNEFNNTFEPVFVSGFNPQHYAFYVFNRWGEIIFESHNALFGWDGTYHGEYCQEGTYTWLIQFKDESTDKKYVLNGTVNLIK
jgi:gliding motility-associated-like protein